MTIVLDANRCKLGWSAPQNVCAAPHEIRLSWVRVRLDRQEKVVAAERPMCSDGMPRPVGFAIV